MSSIKAKLVIRNIKGADTGALSSSDGTKTIQIELGNIKSQEMDFEPHTKSKTLDSIFKGIWSSKATEYKKKLLEVIAGQYAIVDAIKSIQALITASDEYADTQPIDPAFVFLDSHLETELSSITVLKVLKLYAESLFFDKEDRAAVFQYMLTPETHKIDRKFEVRENGLTAWVDDARKVMDELKETRSANRLMSRVENRRSKVATRSSIHNRNRQDNIEK